MIDSVGRTLAIGAAMMITAQHATFGPCGRSGVQEGGLDVADQTKHQWPGVWADSMSVAGFLNDRDLANQHADSVLDRNRVQGRVVGIENNHR